MRIEVVQGDITLQEVDAIVNAANSSLLGGGGVDGAIHRRGGPAILEACRAIRRDHYRAGLPTGEAVATTGGNLAAGWVIHTVGPVYSASRDPAGELAACYRNALRVANEVGARSVAFPAISTGAFGYPMPEAAGVAVRAVRQAKAELELVRFVLFNPSSYEVFVEALAAPGFSP